MARCVVGLPTAAVFLLFWTLIVSFTAAFVGAFVWFVVLPAAAWLVYLTRRWMPASVAPTPWSVLTALIATAAVGAWIVVNMPYASEVLVVQRDAGFLTLEGLWLSENRSAGIDVGSGVAVAQAVPGVFASSDAFSEVDGILRAQGATGFPVLLGLSGWVAGPSGVLAGNLLIAGVALLALHDLARRLMGPGWALVPVALVALSMPMVYFSRTPFTEPLSMALLLGSVTAMVSAIQTRSAGRMSLAASMAGSVALVRIDGALIATGLLAGIVASTLVAAPGGETARFLRRSYRPAAATSVGLVALGAGALIVQSPDYFDDLRGELFLLLATLAGVAAAGLLVLHTPVGAVTAAWLDARRLMVARVVGTAVVAGFVVLGSRPRWWESHNIGLGSSYSWQVMSIQAQAGLPVDGTRSYDEMTVTWLAWYLGWPSVALAGLGAASMVLLAVRVPRVHLAAAITTLGLASLLYVVRPSITPDQVWAMRRLLLAALPAAALLAAWLLDRIWRTPWALARAVSLIGACAALVVPLTWWGGPLRTAVDQGGRADQIQALCNAIPDGSKVITARTGFNPTLLPTLRIACGAEVVEVRDPLTPELIGRIRAAWGGSPVVVATFSPDSVKWLGQPAPIHESGIWRWEETFYPPTVARPWPFALYVGEALPDGRVRAVHADGSRDCESITCPEFLPGPGLQSVMGEGWWELEEWGVWSTDRATLMVPTGQCRVDCRAILRLRGPLPETHVTVRARDSEEMLVERGVFLDQELVVPLDPGLEVTELEVLVHPTFTPSEAGFSEDTRALGVGLRGIAVVGS